MYILEQWTPFCEKSQQSLKCKSHIYLYVQTEQTVTKSVKIPSMLLTSIFLMAGLCVVLKLIEKHKQRKNLNEWDLLKKSLQKEKNK